MYFTKLLYLYSFIITILFVSSMMPPFYSMALSVNVLNESTEDIKFVIQRYDLKSGISSRIKSRSDDRICYFRGDHPIKEYKWNIIILQDDKILFNVIKSYNEMPVEFIISSDGTISEEGKIMK